MDDDLRLLTELRADAPEPDADRLRTLRARAMKPSRRRRRFLLLPSVLALALAVAAAAVTLNGDIGLGVQLPAPAVHTELLSTSVLRQAALVAERRERDDVPRADQWVYRKVAIEQATPLVQEYWTRYDGTEHAYRENGGPMERRRAEVTSDELTPRQYAAKLAALPTDPRKLLAHVKKDPHWLAEPKGGLEESPDEMAFRVLSLYLEQEVATPPRLEAAIFRALAEIPGIRVERDVRDAAGREGIGLALEGGEQSLARSYIVLDPETYRFLGRRVNTLRDEVLDGEVLSRKGDTYATAELGTGVVDQPGRLP
ncbi:CU044_5270 family protein [Nonomuraea insulae]|uniref:CU044_5270 family protein n=1 Tax=Nonomuraea insulae TaxID=1616787 RepID=A0ABW1D459_9ACTN